MKPNKSKTTPNLPPARVLRIRDAAAYLGATVWYVRTQVWAGKLHPLKGRTFRFDRVELDRFVDRQGK